MCPLSPDTAISWFPELVLLLLAVPYFTHAIPSGLASSPPLRLSWQVTSTGPQPPPVPEVFLFSSSLKVHKTLTFPTTVLATLL